MFTKAARAAVTSDGRHVIDLVPATSESINPSPPIFGSDLAAVARAKQFAICGQLSAHALSTYKGEDILEHNPVVSLLVWRANGQALLTLEQAVLVLLLGWRWLVHGDGDGDGDGDGGYPEQARLRSFLAEMRKGTFVLEGEAKRFEETLWGAESVAWMREILRAVAAALESQASE